MRPQSISNPCPHNPIDIDQLHFASIAPPLEAAFTRNDDDLPNRSLSSTPAQKRNLVRNLRTADSTNRKLSFASVTSAAPIPGSRKYEDDDGFSENELKRAIELSLASGHKNMESDPLLSPPPLASFTSPNTRSILSTSSANASATPRSIERTALGYSQLKQTTPKIQRRKLLTGKTSGCAAAFSSSPPQFILNKVAAKTEEITVQKPGTNILRRSRWNVELDEDEKDQAHERAVKEIMRMYRVVSPPEAAKHSGKIKATSHSVGWLKEVIESGGSVMDFDVEEYLERSRKSAGNQSRKAHTPSSVKRTRNRDSDENILVLESPPKKKRKEFTQSTSVTETQLEHTGRVTIRSARVKRMSRTFAKSTEDDSVETGDSVLHDRKDHSPRLDSKTPSRSQVARYWLNPRGSSSIKTSQKVETGRWTDVVDLDSDVEMNTKQQISRKSLFLASSPEPDKVSPTILPEAALHRLRSRPGSVGVEDFTTPFDFDMLVDVTNTTMTDRSENPKKSDVREDGMFGKSRLQTDRRPLFVPPTATQKDEIQEFSDEDQDMPTGAHARTPGPPPNAKGKEAHGSQSAPTVVGRTLLKPRKAFDIFDDIEDRTTAPAKTVVVELDSSQEQLDWDAPLDALFDYDAAGEQQNPENFESWDNDYVGDDGGEYYDEEMDEGVPTGSLSPLRNFVNLNDQKAVGALKPDTLALYMNQFNGLGKSSRGGRGGGAKNSAKGRTANSGSPVASGGASGRGRRGRGGSVYRGRWVTQNGRKRMYDNANGRGRERGRGRGGGRRGVRAMPMSGIENDDGGTKLDGASMKGGKDGRKGSGSTGKLPSYNHYKDDPAFSDGDLEYAWETR